VHDAAQLVAAKVVAVKDLPAKVFTLLIKVFTSAAVIVVPAVLVGVAALTAFSGVAFLL